MANALGPEGQMPIAYEFATLQNPVLSDEEKYFFFVLVNVKRMKKTKDEEEGRK